MASRAIRADNLGGGGGGRARARARGGGGGGRGRAGGGGGGWGGGEAAVRVIEHARAPVFCQVIVICRGVDFAELRRLLPAQDFDGTEAEIGDQVLDTVWNDRDRSGDLALPHLACDGTERRTVEVVHVGVR